MALHPLEERWTDTADTYRSNVRYKRELMQRNSTKSGKKKILKKATQMRPKFANRVICECGRSFSYQHNFLYHKKSECGKTFRCTICPHTDTTNHRLRKHMRIVHNVE